jgi:DNA primase
MLDRAHRVDLAALVSRDVKLWRENGWFVGLCPFHKEKTGSFKIKDNRFHCFGCGAHGDAIDWTQRRQNLDFPDAVRCLAGMDTVPMLRLVSKQNVPAPSEASPEVTKARGIWRQAVCVRGTPVETYMRARGLSIIPGSIRAIDYYNWHFNVALPVMVVAIQGPTGHIIGVQLTALTPDGTCKAFGDRSRRTEGILAAGAARFAAAGETLGLAEGSEKAIAAMELSGIPTWASLGAGRMHNVLIPRSVKELHLFGDDDEAGRAAVARIAQRYKHVRVIVRFPPEGRGDWDEILLARHNK